MRPALLLLLLSACGPRYVCPPGSHVDQLQPDTCICEPHTEPDTDGGWGCMPDPDAGPALR
jgi:hypothetical protein